MKTTNPRARYIRSWQPAANSIAWIATAVAIVMTTGICLAAPPIGVSCALPYTQGQATTSCVGEHKITFNTFNTDGNAKVTAELMGLDGNANLIKSFIVQNGNLTEMGSRMSKWLWEFKQFG